MEPSDHYVHGTDPEEQRRLSKLNALLNAESLRAMALEGGERILDVGSGLGQLTRMMARKAGGTGQVVAVERHPEQLAEARRQAKLDGEEALVDFRAGDAFALPLSEGEWGSFDVAHARFLLEHVPDPASVVETMLRAVRPGGRIILEDDDHDVLRLWPEPPGVTELWRAYFLSYTEQGKNPYVGRHLVSLLHDAGARPRSNHCLFFGSCAGSANFEVMVDNFIGIIEGAREEILSATLSDGRRFDEGLASFRAWKDRPDAAMWYTTSWAEGVRPGAEREATVSRMQPRPESAPPEKGEAPIRDEASLLRFLMDAAAELNSSLELDEVFRRIARGIRPLIDYHLFCIGLWNEETQLLEHSFSMKYGEVISQKGGFPMGYGISGSAAALGRAVRVDNVLEDERYVRYRHPEVEIHSELAVPLVFRDQLIGVIDLESTETGYFTEEHEQALSALASHIAVALVNARMHERVLRDEKRLERDLATAREIQRRLLPDAVPNLAGLEIGTAYSPARELGGDFYDFLRYRDRRLAFAVADVAGKSAPAALLGSMVVGLARGQLADRGGEPAEVLGELNRQLQSLADNRFVAMTYGVFDEKSRRISLSNAGFPRPLLAKDGALRELPIDGTPLGMFSGTSYTTESWEVAEGDVLVLCSDGLMEAEDDRGETFQASALESNLRSLLPRSAGTIAEGLSNAAIEFIGATRRQRDDYTVVVLKF